jgi:hypothetical protein
LKVTDGEQTLYLHWDETDGVWTSDPDEYVYPLGSGVVEFWFAGGMVHLSVDGLELLDCGDGCFTGGPLTGHVSQEGEVPCEADTFTLCVECHCCPIPGWDGPGWYCVEDTGPADCIPVYIDAGVPSCDGESYTICSGPYATREEAEEDCSGGGPGPLTECCSGGTISDTLTVTVSAKTGDCVCLPDNFTLTWVGGSAFTASLPGVCGLNFSPRLQCDPGGTSWSIQQSVATGGCVFFKSVSSFSCDPLVVVFAGVSISGCCAGTATFTVTE